MNNFRLDPNEDPATGLERVASFVNENAEARRRHREQVERESEESRRCNSQKNNEKEGAVSSRYESLNYEIVENKLYRAEEMESGHQVYSHFSQKRFYFPSTNYLCFLLYRFNSEILLGWQA